MSVVGFRIRWLAVAGVLSLVVSRQGTAQMAGTVEPLSADTLDAVSIQTTTVTLYRVREPASVPTAKSEIKGRAPSKNAVWVPGFWNLQGDRNTAPRAGWVWVPGRWLTPPVRQAHWFPAHWGWSDGWWSWIPGHWTQGEDWVPAPLSEGD